MNGGRHIPWVKGAVGRHDRDRPSTCPSSRSSRVAGQQPLHAVSSKVWTLDAYRGAAADYNDTTLHMISLQIALVVVLISVVLGTIGAMASARYEWRGRSLFSEGAGPADLLSQPVLGLALLLSMSAIGIAPTWKSAVIAHAVWIVPIVTLVISIRLFGYDVAQEEAAAFDLGASRWQVAREVTLARAVARHLFWRAVRVPAVVVQSSALGLYQRAPTRRCRCGCFRARHELFAAGARHRRHRHLCVGCHRGDTGAVAQDWPHEARRDAGQRPGPAAPAGPRGDHGPDPRLLPSLRPQRTRRADGRC